MLLAMETLRFLPNFSNWKKRQPAVNQVQILIPLKSERYLVNEKEIEFGPTIIYNEFC